MYHQELSLDASPEVLVLMLKRWDYVRTASGTFVQQLVPHSVVPSEVLQFFGEEYRLQSAIAHLGDSAHVGHYVAVARHDTPGGQWWLYDDDRRVLASADHLRMDAGHFLDRT